ncbi:hypothetical protein K492DRAFT_210038 [Lichtheimia hyalospora FSU 10163]|nr:hypothetical protein K492DRAFT_210038 [Lichtheimia hyalospora FSU 10163]
MPAQALTTTVPPFQKLVLFSGNVMRSSVAGRTKAVNKKGNAELLDAINDTLRTSLGNPTSQSYRYCNDESLLEVPDLRFESRILPEDRNDVEVTAKLFILDQNETESSIDQALEHLRRLLGVEYIDNFILSIGSATCVAPLTQAWKRLETLHQKDTLGKLGVAELTEEQLEKILSDDAITVKPSVNQINVSQCCNMPSSMINLAKKHGVELLHNGDRSDILDTATLSKILQEHNVIDTHGTVAPRWVLKYHVFVQCRSIVRDKGYIVVGDTQSS